MPPYTDRPDWLMSSGTYQDNTTYLIVNQASYDSLRYQYNDHTNFIFEQPFFIPTERAGFLLDKEAEREAEAKEVG